MIQIITMTNNGTIRSNITLKASKELLVAAGQSSIPSDRDAHASLKPAQQPSVVRRIPGSLHDLAAVAPAIEAQRLIRLPLVDDGHTAEDRAVEVGVHLPL